MENPMIGCKVGIDTDENGKAYSVVKGSSPGGILMSFAALGVVVAHDMNLPPSLLAAMLPGMMEQEQKMLKGYIDIALPGKPAKPKTRPAKPEEVQQ